MIKISLSIMTFLFLSIPALCRAGERIMRNELNQFVGEISKDGIVRNDITTIGMIKPDGTIRNTTTITGKITADGSIRNDKNQLLGKIEADGTVRNDCNQVLGKIHSNGEVRNEYNQCLGVAQNIPKEWVAIFFFFDLFD
jgi:hypothetical protein